MKFTFLFRTMPANLPNGSFLGRRVKKGGEEWDRISIRLRRGFYD